MPTTVVPCAWKPQREASKLLQEGRRRRVARLTERLHDLSVEEIELLAPRGRDHRARFEDHLRGSPLDATQQQITVAGVETDAREQMQRQQSISFHRITRIARNHRNRLVSSPSRSPSLSSRSIIVRTICPPDKLWIRSDLPAADWRASRAAVALDTRQIPTHRNPERATRVGRACARCDLHEISPFLRNERQRASRQHLNVRHST